MNLENACIVKSLKKAKIMNVSFEDSLDFYIHRTANQGYLFPRRLD